MSWLWGDGSCKGDQERPEAGDPKPRKWGPSPEAPNPEEEERAMPCLVFDMCSDVVAVSGTYLVKQVGAAQRPAAQRPAGAS